MDYMLRTLLEHGGNTFYKFEARESADWLTSVSLSSNKTDVAE
jgi:hypothetical protein